MSETAPQTMSLREVRDSLGQRVDAAHFAAEDTIITRVGHERAVIVSYDWYVKAREAITENSD